MLKHVFASRHFLNMLGYFIGAAAVLLISGITMTAGTLLTGVLAAGIVGSVGLIFWLFSTISLRSMFGLMQTGRVVQYVSFFLGTWLGVCLATLLLPALVVSHSWLAAMVVYGLAFGSATLTGEVPTKGRTWLPVRMPK